MPIRGASDGGCGLRIRVLFLITILALTMAAPAQAGSSVTESSFEETAVSVSDDVYAQATQTNNSTTLHENPQKADEEGDTQQLKSHLVQFMAQRLGQSMVQLNQSEYQRADQLLGPQYTDALEKYVDVAGETGNGEETATEFERAQNRQQKFTNSTQNYRQIYQKYQEARENGNIQRARKLARQLNNIVKNVNQRGNSLQKSFTRIENGTNTNLSQPSQTVTTIQQNISEQQENVLDIQFAETEITASTESEQVSFDNPAHITGILRTENGTPITDRDVTIRVGNRTVETTTGVDGSYGVSYRPTTVPATATNITVRYIPDDSSRYLSSNTSVPLDVQPVNGTLEITRMPERTAYNQTISVTGLFTVDDVPVGGVPVEVTLGGVSLGVVQTNSAGGFLVETRVPASVPAGQQPLQLQMANGRPALGAEPVSRPVQVNSTATTITATANHTGEQTIQISGRLTTANGTPLVNQPVTIQTPGPSQVTVTTNVNGRYQTSLSLTKDDIRNNGAITITAVFPGGGSSLERAQAQDTVTLPISNEVVEKQESWLPFDWRSLLVGGGILVLSFFGAWFLLRDGSDSSTDGATGRSDEEDLGPGSITTSLLMSARERLRQGNTDDAVRSAYAAVRQWGEDVYDVANIRTHWEFYRATHDLNSTEESELLQKLTESYERAAFDQRQTDKDEADSAVETASRLVNSDDSE